MEMHGSTKRATGVANCTATLFGRISQKIRTTSVMSAVEYITAFSPTSLVAISVASAADQMLQIVQPIRIVLRKRGTPRANCPKLELSPSCSASSRTFQGHNVVMLVSAREKNEIPSRRQVRTTQSPPTLLTASQTGASTAFAIPSTPSTVLATAAGTRANSAKDATPITARMALLSFAVLSKQCTMFAATARNANTCGGLPLWDSALS
mmetsp:Transcript_13898/g.50621  ORF Transcript_13898/g.50621 Transcript_13898/m.50621 type:complete len:209 (-) Transcript_13898:513-1139(-)